MEYKVKLAQEGSNNAFESLIRDNEVNMYRVAKAILQSDEDCADAIQETILKSYKSLTHLRQPNYFKTWLTRILINECKSILRHRKKIIATDNIIYDTKDINDYEMLDLKQAIEKLDSELKIVVLLYYFEDLSVEVISEILHIPAGTVKSRLSRARSYLYEKIK